MGTLIFTAVVIGNVLTSSMFCSGIRSIEEQNGWTYKEYFAEYALDLAAAQGIEEQAVLEALDDGASVSDAHMRGVLARADAKAKMAVRHGERAQQGQKALCGKVSNNW